MDTASSASSMLGNALHWALKYYMGGDPDIPTPADDAEAIIFGHDKGLEYLQNYPDGFIKWNTTIPDRAKLMEKYAFAYFEYIKDLDYTKRVKEIVLVEAMLTYKVEVEGHELPIPLKGAADMVYINHKDQMIIRDHKFTSKYSADEAIEGDKLLQAAFLYFLVYAHTGRAPYSIEFAECKTVKNSLKNKDGTLKTAKELKQVHDYEFVYEENPMIFQFFYRMYEDVTDILLGKSRYLPNVNALYDKEVALLAYIYKLDIEDNRLSSFKEMKVDNITDFLKKKIAKEGHLKKYMEVIASKFVSATTLNYKNMEIEDKIKMKYAEHGMGLEFFDKIVGGAVTLYRFDPAVGIKMSKVEAFVKDIEQVVEKENVRILAPIPNTGYIGFEIPNLERTFPNEVPDFEGYNIPIGVDINNKVELFDIREAPHMLIAGATGSGKSVFMTHMIKALLKVPNSQIHLIDPKMVELAPFMKQASSYQSDIESIKDKLSELWCLMNDRYEILQQAGARNVGEYKGDMPYHFIFIDEFADLMMTAAYSKKTEKARKAKLNLQIEHAEGGAAGRRKKESAVAKMEILIDKSDEMSIEDLITMLAQKARAAGIHIIMATQRPSVNFISGAIKANFPTRVAFRTSSAIDSQVVIDQAGAEKLLGKGDMLFISPTSSIKRLQGFNN